MFLIYFIIVFLIIITSHGQYCYCSSSSNSNSSSDLQTGYRFSLPVPVLDSVDNLFTGGRAFIMEADGQQTPDFRVAVSVEQEEEEEEEDIDKKMNNNNNNRKLLFSCSLDVFLGEVRVWSSGHSFRFYAVGECVVELTIEGDLLLKGQNQIVGWKTGTSGQGVQRLQLLRNGNLVLVDTLNQIKWQSFNFPTDTMLWSQTLNVATRLTSTFPTPTTTTTRFSFSFDIEPQKIALYLINSAANYSNSNSKYAFWEYKPSDNRNLTFIKVSRQGLDIFDQSGKKISRIQSHRRLEEPIRFLALDNKTGSLGLYYYSAIDGNFKAAFRVPNSTCDLPLACQPYGICTLTNVCTSSFINNNYYYKAIKRSSSCDAATRDVEMVDLRRNVWSVITGIPVDLGNLSSTKDRCTHTCMNNCKCAAALYDPTSRGSCFLYEFVRGLKELPIGSSPNFISYMVKVPKADVVGKGSSSLKGWILAMVAATDALVVLLVFLGIVYYCVISKRRRSYSHQTN